jgi:hypothetical protein
MTHHPILRPVWADPGLPSPRQLLRGAFCAWPEPECSHTLLYSQVRGLPAGGLLVSRSPQLSVIQTRTDGKVWDLELRVSAEIAGTGEILLGPESQVPCWPAQAEMD